MSAYITEYKGTVSYFIWDYTRNENALDSWYCAEDIAYYVERAGIAERDELAAILRLRRNSPVYIDFMRNIAFRIYLYTGCGDALKNWYIAERLTQNGEWLDAVIALARAFHEIKAGEEDLQLEMQCDMIRNFYKPNQDANFCPDTP